MAFASSILALHSWASFRTAGTGPVPRITATTRYHIATANPETPPSLNHHRLYEYQVSDPASVLFPLPRTSSSRRRQPAPWIPPPPSSRQQASQPASQPISQPLRTDTGGRPGAAACPRPPASHPHPMQATRRQPGTFLPTVPTSW